MAWYVIIGLIIAAVLFGLQVKENIDLKRELEGYEDLSCFDMRRQRFVFFAFDNDSRYIEKLVETTIKARMSEDIKILSRERDSKLGIDKVILENGDIVILKYVDGFPLMGELPALLDFEELIFFDYKVAPNDVLAQLKAMGLRNYVYKFSIIDEKGVK